MRLRIAIPEEHVSPAVLNAGLEALTKLDEKLIREGHVPTFRQAVAAGKVKWAPEPPGDERFDHAGIVLGRGFGDCDDLAPYHCAGLRVTGEDPGCRAVVKRSGPRRWHAIVQRSDGSLQDPSKAAGMGGARGVVVGGAAIYGACPPVCSPMVLPSSSVVGAVAEWRPMLAARPLTVNGRPAGWEARVDVPTGVMKEEWTQNDWALSALNRAPIPSTALTGALAGACLVGDESALIDPRHRGKLLAVAGLLDGDDPEHVARMYGGENLVGALEVVGALESVGFNFGKLFNKLAPLVSKVVRFIPFVGPVASTALDVVTDLHLVPDGDGPGKPSLKNIADTAGKLLGKVNLPGGMGNVASAALDLASQMTNQRLASPPPRAAAPAPRPAPVPVRAAPAPRPAPPPPRPAAAPAWRATAVPPPHMAALEAYPGGHIILRF